MNVDEFRLRGLREVGSQLGTVPRVANPRRAGRWRGVDSVVVGFRYMTVGIE